MGGRADHDRGGPDRVGILGDQPPGCAVIGGVKENLAFGGDVMCGELLQMPAHHRPGGTGVLHIDPAVAGGRMVHVVHAQEGATGEPSMAARITPLEERREAAALPATGTIVTGAG